MAITLFGCHVEVTGAADANEIERDDGAVAASDAPPEIDGAVIEADAAPPIPTRPPIMIAAANYVQDASQLGGLAPFMVYAWATDPAIENPARYDQEIALLAAIDDPQVEKLIMFSSYRTMQDRLAAPGHAAYLHSIGVDLLGYNSEGFMTPSDEMNSLDDSDPSSNAVARFADIAAGYGFSVLWGPIRSTADAVSDAAIATMFGAGLAGVGLQEQQFIENACVTDRAAAVAQTSQRYKTIAAQQGVTAHINVQIMPSRCLAGDSFATTNCGTTITAPFVHCARFVDAIATSVDSYAIWASGPSDLADLVALIAAMRAE